MTRRERYEAVYTFQPVDHMPRQDHYFWPEALERWRHEGLPADWEAQNFFHFDPPEFGRAPEVDLGWVDTPLIPAFEACVLEETENYQVIQDPSGRIKRIFRDLPTLAMPTYLRHAVSCQEDWEAGVKHRLDPTTPERWTKFEAGKANILADSAGGKPPYWVFQGVLGGYMYLRNMFGPEDLLYAFYDKPALIHDLMQTWFDFMDYSFARIQGAYALDHFTMAEDICYKTSMLISPAQFREFLLPYYKEFFSRARARNTRPLFIGVDTDGNPDVAIPLYLECGMDQMEPFEVAAGQDIVAKGRQYPGLVLTGGLDKRLLTEGADLARLDAELERILPVMRARGGYIPTIDHGIPPDVPLANYVHFREKMIELDPG
jgi:uroporphyrinogen decarboxylase